MYLSKLELHGFKSFADRTTVHFAPGVTVVVGPNGCGKSNIVDAVRWVIGEQRARILRSEKMDNVIFNGTAGRRPLGMSEVLLTIENTRGILPTEYTEVTIGRRLYRSGESEYLLNGVQCRLKDITDLFMDTGMGAGAYSVIELKMIEDLLSENAEDRRHLFEEAAGITKYKMRRAQTLRKLDSTQVDLTRVRDLVEELDRRVRSLERQAQKAARWKSYREELSTVELALAQFEFDRMRAQREEVHRERVILGDRLEGESAALATAEAGYEVRRTEHIEREQALVAAQQAHAGHVEALRRLEADERVTRERLGAAERDLVRLAEEAASAAARRVQLEESRTTFVDELELARPAAADADRVHADALAGRDAASGRADERRRALEAARSAERQSADRLSETQRILDRTVARQDMLREDLARAEAELEPARDALADGERQASAALERLEAARTARDRAREAVETALAERSLRTETLERQRAALRETQRGLDAAASEVALLESLLSSYDEFAEPVQYLASSREWTKAELRTVADCFSCDDAVRPALEAALGDYAECLVVATEDEARRAIAGLRRDRKGRATFLVLERLPAGAGARQAGSLAERVRVPEAALEPLAGVLLGDCHLVDSLDEALARAAASGGSGRWFAPSGEWVSPSGVVRGGSEQSGASPAAGRIGRREQLAEAAARRDAAARGVAGAEAAVTAAQQALEALGVAALEQALRQAEQAVAAAQTEEARARVGFDGVKRRLGELEARVAQLSGSLAGAGEDIAARTAAHAEASELHEGRRASRAEEELRYAEAEAESHAASTRFGDARIAAVQARNRLENLERELSRAVEALALLERQKTERDAAHERAARDRDESTDRIRGLVAELETRRTDAVGLERAVVEAKDRLSETKVAISEIEANLRELRRRREQTLRDENLLAVREAELQTRTENLVSTIALDFDVDLAAVRIEVPPDLDPEAARAQVQDLRSKLRNLGPVNELALEAYDEERERLDFLRTQLKDLESAEATLLETIHEINTTASERFRETFEAIRSNFTGLFTTLFGEEASADVVLEAPDDPLESTIEIMAKPRGKRPSVLAQLSGGEKTLTAIALLFAIYLVKPSPFCILDEVDAPLDDANVDRFMNLIRTFADTTQFILVTHNKRTMEGADRMYGITMQEQGVSRLVGVRFDQEVAQVA